jgi:cytochrome c553
VILPTTALVVASQDLIAMRTLLLRIPFLFAFFFPTHPSFADASTQYSQLCAGCHSANPATYFRDSPLIQGGDEQQIAQTILNGRPDRGMPSFKQALSERQASELARFIRATSAPSVMIGRTVEAEDLRGDRSAGYAIAEEGQTRFLQFVDADSRSLATICTSASASEVIGKTRRISAIRLGRFIASSTMVGSLPTAIRRDSRSIL